MAEVIRIDLKPIIQDVMDDSFIVDDIVTEDSSLALSANQGVVLAAMIQDINDELLNGSKVEEV